MEKYGRPGEETDENTIERLRFACWITKAGDTNSDYVILFLFQDDNCHANAPRYFFLRIMPAW